MVMLHKMNAAKNWLIRTIFATINTPHFYRSWCIDQWYIARTKGITEYVRWSHLGHDSRIYVIWIGCGLFDMVNVLTSVDVFRAYVWLAIGMSYMLAGILAVCITCMSAKYNSAVDCRVRNILCSDWKTLHNARVCSCTHDGLTRDCFAVVLHRQLINRVHGVALFWLYSDRELAFDFADIADSITTAMNGGLE